MLMNLSNLMFLLFLVLSSMLAISSNSWVISWMGLEMNLFFFIPLMKTYNNNMTSEFIMKYFIIQAISSANLMLMVTLTHLLSESTLTLFMININFTLLLKLGSAPFHLWYINIIESLSWMNFLLISTWQKIAPLILLSYFLNSYFLFVFSAFNCIIGSIGGMNQLYLRKLMAFSSINNTGWMFSAFMISETLWSFFFFLYSFMLLSISVAFKLINLSNMNQLMYIKINKFYTILILLNFLSIGGIPPMIGFLPKWMIINALISLQPLLTLILIITSLINLFFYFRLMYPIFMLNSISMKSMLTPYSIYSYFPALALNLPIFSMIFCMMIFYIY
uniref:NADH dehydrogenase subunit 2 n=1 Tax=Parapsyche elsis TaxID=177890 RepID=UPI002238185F|nr:NADH dehydrogenase subunit 2 [Parapsyche elsis]UYO79344.1 NADH dehydrogenase subunit 2 [Parapsyche elsis]